jgi:hypothetical protein
MTVGEFLKVLRRRNRLLDIIRIIEVSENCQDSFVRNVLENR